MAPIGNVILLGSFQTTSEWSELSRHIFCPFTADPFVSALDYPPFFAYFEKLLSIPASYIDPKIVDLNNLNYDSWSVIVYQRTTVILTELVLGAAVLR